LSTACDVDGTDDPGTAEDGTLLVVPTATIIDLPQETFTAVNEDRVRSLWEPILMVTATPLLDMRGLTSLLQ
jgi:hypothetical protein